MDFFCALFRQHQFSCVISTGMNGLRKWTQTSEAEKKETFLLIKFLHAKNNGCVLVAPFDSER